MTAIEPSGPSIGTLDETRGWLGREMPVESVDEVTRNDIRRKLEVFGFYCPLYYDEAIARAHGYRTIVAPAAMIRLWAMGPYWKPGDPPPYPDEPEKQGTIHAINIPAPGSEGVNVGSEWEYFEPLHPGDRISGVWKLSGVAPKRTRLGEGAFLTTESTYRKQTGEVVAVEINTVFRFTRDADPVEDAQQMVSQETEPAAAWQGPSAAIDWASQRFFDDVAEGEEIPSHSIPITYQRLVMGIASDRMFSPIHHNRDYARSVGLDDIIVNTMFYEMLYEITLREWIGLDGKIRKLGPFRMIQNSHPGDIVTCHGRVTKKEIVDGQSLVRLDVWDETPRRGVVTRGEAAVSLPHRSSSR